MTTTALLDTHLLVWAAGRLPQLPPRVEEALSRPAFLPFYSVVSIWETVIKAALRRPDFRVDAAAFRRRLLDNGYRELDVVGSHVLAVRNLPPLHGDPFDRLLLAQAQSEGLPFWTVDRRVLSYGPPAVDMR